jgi:hypothetical protein
MLSILLMYKDKEVNKNVKIIFLSMCDVKVSLTFTSLNLVLLWQLLTYNCRWINMIFLSDKHNINSVLKYKVYMYSAQNWGKSRWTSPFSQSLGLTHKLYTLRHNTSVQSESRTALLQWVLIKISITRFVL